MARVKRTALLWLLLASSCLFLLFQLLHYRKYDSKPLLRRTPGHVTASDLQWQTVKTFLHLVRRFRLPLFLADPFALGLLTADGQRSSPESGCAILCRGRAVTAFGLLADAWTYNTAFLSAAEQKGFEALELRGDDPRLAGLDLLSGEDVPLHLLLRLRGHVIQVVFLYKRSGNYLWHGPMRLKADTDRDFAPFATMDFGRYAGAYNRPRLVLTVVDGLDVAVPRNISGFLAERGRARFLECRYRDARRFLQLYPDDNTPQALDFGNKAKSLLRLAAETLARLHVPFWISSGTCLGWFRQCSFIAYSRDVDIGIFIDDFRPDIISAFQEAGLSLKHKFGKVEDSLELSFVRDGVKLDIFFFYRDGDLTWNGGTQAKSGRKFKYWFPGFSLCWAELAEVRVGVPCETLDYVTANYGEAWSVPQRTWDWKTSPSNVQENGVWPPSQWEELIQVY
ncbi:fukutin [Corythoichthys intestinalis]|uniref:fukutin n=1 Tax=Corythoichthys intestinalis TaxID=161448 RepID=UPI0025A60E10|nr:fukutin [Corythoichthys intestinalis]XP_061800820.1 ribitol-5-phosphate transferase FKTN-like isoform X2 [Nerophis lumbriciformis]